MTTCRCVQCMNTIIISAILPEPGGFVGNGVPAGIFGPRVYVTGIREPE